MSLNVRDMAVATAALLAFPIGIQLTALAAGPESSQERPPLFERGGDDRLDAHR